MLIHHHNSKRVNSTIHTSIKYAPDKKIKLVLNCSSFCMKTTGEVKEFYLLICNRGNYFRLIQSWSFIHKIFIHSASLYFSFRTRKIKVPVLNEYKSTSASAYSTVVFIILTAILLFPLANYPNIYVICYTLLLFTLISIFVSFTFIPKVYNNCDENDD